MKDMPFPAAKNLPKALALRVRLWAEKAYPSAYN